VTCSDIGASRITGWKPCTRDIGKGTLAPVAGRRTIGGNSSGGDIGSSIGTVHFIQCDFDGDGVRDVPTYKEAPAQAGYGPW